MSKAEYIYSKCASVHKLWEVIDGTYVLNLPSMFADLVSIWSRTTIPHAMHSSKSGIGKLASISVLIVAERIEWVQQCLSSPDVVIFLFPLRHSLCDWDFYEMSLIFSSSSANHQKNKHHERFIYVIFAAKWFARYDAFMPYRYIEDNYNKWPYSRNVSWWDS